MGGRARAGGPRSPRSVESRDRNHDGLSADNLCSVATTDARSAARARTLRDARIRAGLTQAELGRRLKAPASNISAYEAGTRPMSDEMYARILVASRPLPSVVLQGNADLVKQTAARYGAIDVRVFGSVARGRDRWDSDIDLLMTFRPDTDLFDLFDLTEELRSILGTEVDILSVGGLSDRDGHIRAEAIPL